jgi:hypothetical protein
LVASLRKKPGMVTAREVGADRWQQQHQEQIQLCQLRKDSLKGFGRSYTASS